MARFIGFVFIVFCGLVMINYLFALAGHAFSGGGLAYLNQGSDQLASIDFSFFGKNGTGRSYITQGYGWTSFSYAYKGDRHDGIDIAAAYGAPVYSPGDGTVFAVGNQDDYCFRRGFGKYVAVKDGTNHLILWFAHLGTIAVSPGDTVKTGTLIGTVGTTGFETGTHLHFSIFNENGFSMTQRNGCGPDPTGRDLDPLSYLGTTYK
ncbi:MAG: M23 family metallopeptidase [Minisyncoccia bacterium]|jgi:murein DD-endopeptidase MepM/ murein hydrolase activator NlpD